MTDEQQSLGAPAPGAILVMVGTRKGTFLFWSNDERRTWQRSEHHLGWSTRAMSYDPRCNTIYAAVSSDVFGGLVQRSRDGGRTWEHFNAGLDFAADEERRVRQIWQVQPGHAQRPGEVWAGTGEAGLFRSSDEGAHWQSVDGLNRRIATDTWMPGGGGLILHTILVDPTDANRLYAAISAGGAYRSDDGGTTWQPINRGVDAGFLPDAEAETGHCVHKLALHPARPEVLFQQNHMGFYRSDNRGETWTDISAGLPSRFGFPAAIHSHDPHTVYAVPLVADERRFVADGQMAVWRTRDDGGHWQPLTNGLPEGAWLNVLRDALATDPVDPCGVYVGTTGGHLFYSRDEGETWQSLTDYLPPVQSVAVARVVES